MPKVTVMFRTYPSGGVSVIMPEEFADNDPANCCRGFAFTSGGIIGDRLNPVYVIENTVLATPEEYTPLLDDLCGLYEVNHSDFIILKRINLAAYARKRLAAYSLALTGK